MSGIPRKRAEGERDDNVNRPRDEMRLRCCGGRGEHADQGGHSAVRPCLVGAAFTGEYIG